MLPAAKSDVAQGRKRTTDLREVIDAILYWTRSGCSWDMLPHDFPPSDTVYAYFRQWQRKGIIEEIHEKLRERVRESSGKQKAVTAASIDSQSVKTTDVGGEERGFDGNKKVNGRKRHLLVDTLGLVLVVLVQAANIADVVAAKTVVMAGKLNQPDLQKIWADLGYRGKKLQELADSLEIDLTLSQKKEKSFKVEPRRWVVERTFAWLGKQRRLSKDYERLPEVSEAVVHFAMIPLMLNRLSS
jgi:putative transposase